MLDDVLAACLRPRVCPLHLQNMHSHVTTVSKEESVLVVLRQVCVYAADECSLCANIMTCHKGFSRTQRRTQNQGQYTVQHKLWCIAGSGECRAELESCAP